MVLMVFEVCGIGMIYVVIYLMGGILLWVWLVENEVEGLGYVVMLGLFNYGFEIVDSLCDLILFEWINGFVGMEFGMDGVMCELLEVGFLLGVIVGNIFLNLVYLVMVVGCDDGKVLVILIKVVGMQDYIVINMSYIFMMNNLLVIVQVKVFLVDGFFDYFKILRDVVLGVLE